MELSLYQATEHQTPCPRQLYPHQNLHLHVLFSIITRPRNNIKEIKTIKLPAADDDDTATFFGIGGFK